MSDVFNFKKVSEYINGMERQINQIRAFGKKLLKTYQNSDEQIKKIMQQKSEISQKSKDPALKKQIHIVDFLTVERQHSQANAIWIKNHLDNWVERSKQLPKSMQEQAKKLESKRLNKNLTPQQIEVFKNELTKAAREHNDSVKEIMRGLSHWNAKNCCSLIQTLTNSMKQMKIAQKKRQSIKEEPEKGREKSTNKNSEKINKK